jgi:hypothetical protein
LDWNLQVGKPLKFSSTSHKVCGYYLVCFSCYPTSID